MLSGHTRRLTLSRRRFDGLLHHHHLIVVVVVVAGRGAPRQRRHLLRHQSHQESQPKALDRAVWRGGARGTHTTARVSQRGAIVALAQEEGELTVHVRDAVKDARVSGVGTPPHRRHARHQRRLVVATIATICAWR